MFRECKRQRVRLEETRATPASATPPSTELVTGGAWGADEVWLNCCIAQSIPSSIISFEGHRARVPSRTTTHLRTVVLSRTELQCENVRNRLRDAAKRLQKRVPSPGTFTFNLLARSAHAVYMCDALFAVGRRVPVAGRLARATGVDGGTGWTCEMFASRAATEKDTKLAMFLFDMNQSAWFEWKLEAACWVPIEAPPRPSSFARWSGVGSRELTKSGEDAIKRLF